MSGSQRLQILEEIKRLEQEIERLKKLLASDEAEQRKQEESTDDAAATRTSLADLVRAIGKLSKGGNSVEDTHQERERCGW
jgi:DNA repair exonuclease SbcCD ATPase subunit